MPVPFSAPSATLLLTAGLLCFVTKRAIDYRNARSLIDDWPGWRRLGPGGDLQRIWLPDLLKRGLEDLYIARIKHEDFVKYGWDVLSNVSWYFPVVKLHIADADIIQHICGARTDFPKPTKTYKLLETYGRNVVTTEGDIWVRHRKVSSRAFNESMLQLVWEQANRIVHDMFDSDWALHGDQVRIDDLTLPMKELAMLVLMGAAFGHVEEWTPQPSPPPGHLMPFRQALQAFLSHFILFGILPGWTLGRDQENFNAGGLARSGFLGKSVQTAVIAYAELGRCMCEMIHDRQSVGGGELKRDKRDVFTSLMDAMGNDGDSASMTVDEVFGNMFIFLLAGHETTAHSLAFALGLLALEEQEQEKLYAHINEVLGDQELAFDHHAKLSRVLAVFYEAMRLFPPVTSIPKTNAEDASFLVKPALSEAEASDPSLREKATHQKRLFIPKGSQITLDLAALHYNPRYWKEPYEFKPERFLQPNWPKEAFVVFSAGARGCLGRKFSEIEAVSALTLIIRRYKVSIDTAKFPDLVGETKLARRQRFLRAEPRITLTPFHVPVLFTRR